MRETMICCTLGPSSFDDSIIEQLILNGCDAIRLNLSHGTHKSHKKYIDAINRARIRTKMYPFIIMDTKGPEYRIGNFSSEYEYINEGDSFDFHTSEIIGDKTKVSVNINNLDKYVKPSDTILVDNGLLYFVVSSVKDGIIKTICKIGGKISNKKSINIPGVVIKNDEYLSQKDKEDLLFCIEEEVDIIQCSFVSRKEDILSVRSFLDANGGEDIKLFAKIENLAGIKNLEEICQNCSGIVLGRGDLGMEIPYEKIPKLQKEIIKRCEKSNTPVIIATEMLESMRYNPRPTRAETSDVANAIFDGASGVMLTGETAEGKYPIETLKAMVRIVNQAELDRG